MNKRELLCDMGYEDSIVFENPDYEQAIVGISIDGNVVYDYNLMVEELIEEGMTSEEAVEFIDYNVVRSLPYAGEHAPIIMISLEE
jgi:hypothetical protein